MPIKISCFAKKNRLNNPRDYQNVFRSSCRSVDDVFFVLASKSKFSQARLGLAISKKKVSRGVSRNYIKRVIRESFRHHKQNLSGIDVVVVTRKKLTIINKKKIRESISAHWKIISRCKEY